MLGEYEEGQGKGWHGALDGPVPPKKLEEFMKRAAAAGVAQAKEPAQSDSEVRPAPAPQAAEPRHVGSDGSVGAPPARKMVDGRIVSMRPSAAAAAAAAAAPAAPEARARPTARPRIATLGISDVVAQQAAQHEAERETARRRRDQFERGRLTDLSGGDISRSDPSRWG